MNDTMVTPVTLLVKKLHSFKWLREDGDSNVRGWIEGNWACESAGGSIRWKVVGNARGRHIHGMYAA
jgi:hypothetical protein